MTSKQARLERQIAAARGQIEALRTIPGTRYQTVQAIRRAIARLAELMGRRKP